MKALVIYFSQTGNTKMVAEAISETLSEQIEVDIKTIRSVDMDTLDTYDLLFVGAPCHDGDLAPPVKGFLGNLPKSSKFKLAGFYTHATYPPERDTHTKELFEQWAGKCQPSYENPCREKNIDLIGVFHCQGKANPLIEIFIHEEIITDEEEWNEYLPELRASPTKNDIENAKEFALSMLDEI